MFKGKRLQQENDSLKAELARLQGTPAYRLAMALEAEINGIIENEYIPADQIAPAQERAYTRLREAALQSEVEKVGEQRAERAVAAERAKIDQEAQIIANQIAETAVQRFLAEEAPGYREAAIARLTRTMCAAAIIGAKREIEAQVAAEVGANTLLAPETDMSDRPALKQRAQEIRAHTKNSQLLPYELLNRGDVITVCFVAQGNGHQQLTTFDGYSSSYNSHYEVRKISCRLIDREHSLFVVENDSWFKEPKHKSTAIRGGKEVIIMAEHPDTSEPSSLIVKAAPVSFGTLDGSRVGNTDLEVWWVNLGDFRLLS